MRRLFWVVALVLTLVVTNVYSYRLGFEHGALFVLQELEVMLGNTGTSI